MSRAALPPRSGNFRLSTFGAGIATGGGSAEGAGLAALSAIDAARGKAGLGGSSVFLASVFSSAPDSRGAILAASAGVGFAGDLGGSRTSVTAKTGGAGRTMACRYQSQRIIGNK